ncbi:MAG: hypothetical protein O7D29_05495, partial [Gemmatimonadetes bacterium]|nr:hypothetical protein [Gemmatimonadota bacterium]
MLMLPHGAGSSSPIKGIGDRVQQTRTSAISRTGQCTVIPARGMLLDHDRPTIEKIEMRCNSFQFHLHLTHFQGLDHRQRRDTANPGDALASDMRAVRKNEIAVYQYRSEMHTIGYVAGPRIMPGPAVIRSASA